MCEYAAFYRFRALGSLQFFLEHSLRDASTVLLNVIDFMITWHTQYCLSLTCRYVVYSKSLSDINIDIDIDILFYMVNMLSHTASLQISHG